MSANVTRDQRHSKSKRCPICDGADQDPRGQSRRCTGFTNEAAGYTHCSREELAGALEGKDIQGVTLFAHRLHGACRCGVEHGPAITETRDSIEATYPYVDESGMLLFEVVRKTGKKFLQRRPVPGGWEWKLGDTRRVLYRLPQLIGADPEKIVFIVEGEKDVAALEREGALATCNPGGAGKWSLVAAHAAEMLKGRRVIIVADNDGEKAKFAGQKHAIEIQNTLRGICASLDIKQAPAPHKDAADLLAAGGTLSDLVPFTIPTATESKPAPPPTMRVVSASTLPEIKTGVDIARIADEGIAALAKSDSGIYERGGRLVSVVRISEPPKYRKGQVDRAIGSPLIRTLAYPSLYERLSSAAIWLRKNKKGEFTPTVPHEKASRAIFERGEWGGIPSLVGVTVTPQFRGDGTILQEPGFDPATGLLYWPNARYPSVVASPSQEDARLAYEAIIATVRCFPFAAPSHRAAWVCSLLTVLARTAIDGAVPMFIMDANTRGVGKTKLVDAVFRIVLGFGAPQTALPEQNEEIRKTITSCVLAGDQAILFDNIKRKLGGEGIESAVTAVTWKGRRLGSDDQMSAPMRIVFFATGNNLELTSDLARRSMHIRLESPLENPEDRDDTFNLIEWIEERRHHLVAWGLTILRAWHVAGRPHPTKTMGSFEAWSDVIPQAVAWACGLDPLEARASVDVENDEERMQLNAIVACIETMSGYVTAKQILTSLFGSGDRHDGTVPMDHHPTYAGAREAIEAVTWTKPGQTPSALRLGKYLLRIKGRVVAGRKLEAGPIAHNQHTWGVRKA